MAENNSAYVVLETVLPSQNKTPAISTKLLPAKVTIEPIIFGIWEVGGVYAVSDTKLQYVGFPTG
jgi:hypothetical protein